MAVEGGEYPTGGGEEERAEEEKVEKSPAEKAEDELTADLTYEELMEAFRCHQSLTIELTRRCPILTRVQINGIESLQEWF